MFKNIKKIIKYPRLTLDYPNKPMDSKYFTATPEVDENNCSMCNKCMSNCPSAAISMDKKFNSAVIDFSKCIFCALCAQVCPQKAITMTDRFELAQRDKSKLTSKMLVIEENEVHNRDYESIGSELKDKINKLFGKSLQIREVDAGSCNGCDYEINAFNNPFNDIERFGIHFVASPRHADMLLVTGTATRNMQAALIKSYNATPDPKLVVAVGACACSGGIFKDTYASGRGIDTIIPVDVYVPGCPPRPQAILYGVLKALDRIK